MVPQLDVFKSPKETTSENLRMHIVEMAVKNIDCNEKDQGYASQSLVRENRALLSKRSDATSGNYEEKKNLVVYPNIQRKKECISLNFTSVSKDRRDNNGQSGFIRPEETYVRYKACTPRPYPRNGKTGQNHGFHEHNNVREESNKHHDVTAAAPHRLHLRKESQINPKILHPRQGVCFSARGHIQNNVTHSSNENDKNVDVTDQVNKPKSKNPKAGERDSFVKCEIKGNAVLIPTPLQDHLLSKRGGQFSASLAAFKRRLRMSSRKYNARLNDDNATKEEEYIIAVDKANIKARQDDAMRQSLYPSEDRIKPGRVNLKNPNPRHNLNGIKKPKINMTKNPLENNEYELEQSSNSSWSTPDDEIVGKSNYELRTARQVRTPHQVNFPETLPSVTNAKTYVLETDQLSLVRTKTSEPIPLTAHNLRLHESIITMHARRARRIYRSNQLGNNKSTDAGGLADYALVANERIHRWLENVDEFCEPVESQALEPQSQHEYQIMKPCSAENDFSIRHTHRAARPIFIV